MKPKKWDLIIDWFDDQTYCKLSNTTQIEVKEFRRINHYIDVLSNTIYKDEENLKRLKKSIRERKLKINNHSKRGKILYGKLEPFKSKFEIDVYYSEGKRTKKVLTKSGKVNTHTYDLSNLKYKSKYLSNTKSINLKSKRKDTITELKDICPNWYKNIGEKLIHEKNTVKVRREMVELFKPIIFEIIQRKSKKLRDRNFTIKFKDVLYWMKSKNL